MKKLVAVPTTIVALTLFGCQQHASPPPSSPTPAQTSPELQSHPLFSNPSPPFAPVTLTSAQKQAVEAGVKARLKDPTSPLFGRSRAVRDATGVIYVCGLVNAKNSFGGYIGENLYMGTFIAPTEFRMDMLSNGTSGANYLVSASCESHGLGGSI